MAQPTTVYLTRHGQSEHNERTHVFMGRSPESRLVAVGREQARRLGERLAREVVIDRIVCSSLPRTLETGRIIAEALGHGEPAGDDAFWELSKGDWEGVMPREQLPPEIAAALARDPFGFRYPNGESYRDVTARVGPALERWIGTHAGKRLLFVLHGDVLRALLHHTLRFPPEKIGDFETAPCGLSELSHANGRYALVRFNDTGHLSG